MEDLKGKNREISLDFQLTNKSEGILERRLDQGNVVEMRGRQDPAVKKESHNTTSHLKSADCWLNQVLLVALQPRQSDILGQPPWLISKRKVPPVSLPEILRLFIWVVWLLSPALALVCPAGQYASIGTCVTCPPGASHLRSQYLSRTDVLDRDLFCGSWRDGMPCPSGRSCQVVYKACSNVFRRQLSA